MKGRINILNNAPEELVIDIEGAIGVPERMQFEESGNRISTYGSLRTLLERVREHRPRRLTVNIRSTGGSVADALLIYDTLKECGAEVTTRCFGYAASAATVIAQAASPGRREISANCLYLIHNSSCETEGNSREIESAADMLRQTDDRIAGIYAANSGRAKEGFVRLMACSGGKGRWLPPEEVLDCGLADVIIAQGRTGLRDRRLIRNLGLPPVPGGNAFEMAIAGIFEKMVDAVSGKSAGPVDPGTGGEPLPDPGPHPAAREGTDLPGGPVPAGSPGKPHGGEIYDEGETEDIPGKPRGSSNRSHVSKAMDTVSGKTGDLFHRAIKGQTIQDSSPNKSGGVAALSGAGEKGEACNPSPTRHGAAIASAEPCGKPGERPDLRPVDSTCAAGGSLGEASVSEQGKHPGPLHGEYNVAGSPSNRIPVLWEARKGVFASATKPKEDPSVHGTRLSNNQEAYYEDVKNLKSLI